MKKLAMLISSLLLFSCGNSENVEISKEEYNKLKGVTKKSLGSFPYQKVDELYVIELDSCEYIIYNAFLNKDGAITHKGNCKFCAKRKETNNL